MRQACRRVRAYGGHFALLAVLAMVTALLLAAAPRIANRLADAGLRADLAELPWQARDITYETISPPTGSRIGELDRWQRDMPAAVRRLIDTRWYAAQVGPSGMRASGPDLVSQVRPPLDLGLRTMSGAREAVRIRDGRWPADPAGPDAPIEAAVSTRVAQATGLRVGSQLVLEPGVRVTIVGVFVPIDPGAAIWGDTAGVLRHVPPAGDGQPNVAVALTTDAAITDQRRTVRGPIHFSWRYRLDLRRLDAEGADRVVDGVRRLKSTAPVGYVLTTGLGKALGDFLDALTSVRALLAIVVAGLLAALAGVLVLAARLAVDRRRAEFSLLMARGASRGTLVVRGITETVLVVPLATAIGWAAGSAVPGRADGTGWVAVLATLVTALAFPLATLLSRLTAVGRRDLAAAGDSPVRRTGEVSLLVLAALGAFLIRRRGLPSGGDVDPLLVSVPVLVAIAAALVVLRVYPWPMRLLGRLAARARGTVIFLAAARTGRAVAAAGPVIVVVVAIAVAGFSGVVAGGIAAGRDRAAERAVGADAMLTGDGFAPDTAAELAALPGVRAVAAITSRAGESLYRDAERGRGGVDRVSVLVVDGPAFARVMAESGVDAEVPEALIGATSGSGPVPAVISAAVTENMPDPAFVTLAGKRYELRVAGVVSAFPTMNADRFVVLPSQALPARASSALVPTGFLISAARVDEAALREVGERGQRRWLASGVTVSGDRQVIVADRATYRADLDRGGVNGLLSFTFVTGAVGGSLISLLAVAFAVLAGARARGRALSRLRTLGLSRPQGRGLLVWELTPLVGVAVLTGAAVGALLPVLLAPALRLSAFTAGIAVPVRFEPGVVAGAVVLGGLALGAAIATETLVSRRLRLGEVLRLGEES